MPVQPAYLFLFLPVCCFQRGATFVLVVAWCFTPDGVVDNRQSSRRCVFLLPPLFLSPLLRSPCFVIAFFFFLCFPLMVVWRPTAARMAAVTPVVRRPSYTLLTAVTQLPWHNKGPSIALSMMVLCTANQETIRCKQ